MSELEHTRQAYADEKAYLTRYEIHQHYTYPSSDFPSWVLSRHEWRGDETVLDIGSGPGMYFSPILERIPAGKLLAADLSPGMLRKAYQHSAASQISIMVGDIQNLALAKHSVDIVLANHMLFHVADLQRAIDEIHRVLKTDGVLIASTNSQYSMAEFNILHRRACSLLGHPLEEPDEEPPPGERDGFTLENGTIRLQRTFRAVARHDIANSLIFKDPQPVLDYINSLETLKSPELPAGITWEAYMHKMTDQVHRLINHFGELVISKLTGVLLATDGGGFAETYFSLYDHQD